VREEVAIRPGRQKNLSKVRTVKEALTGSLETRNVETWFGKSNRKAAKTSLDGNGPLWLIEDVADPARGRGIDLGIAKTSFPPDNVLPCAGFVADAVKGAD